MAWEPDTRTGYLAYKEVLEAMSRRRLPCSVAIAYWWVRKGAFLDAGDWVMPSIRTPEEWHVYMQLGRDFVGGIARLLAQHGITVRKAAPAPPVVAPVRDVEASITSSYYYYGTVQSVTSIAAGIALSLSPHAR